LQKTRAQQIVEENRLKAIVIAKFRGKVYANQIVKMVDLDSKTLITGAWEKLSGSVQYVTGTMVSDAALAAIKQTYPEKENTPEYEIKAVIKVHFTGIYIERVKNCFYCTKHQKVQDDEMKWIHVICTEDGKRKVASMNAAACGKYARGAV